MKNPTRKFILTASILVAALVFLAPVHSAAQAAKPSSGDRWIHIRVESTTSKGEMVRINLPLELAEKVLPAINKEGLQNGKVKIEHCDTHGVDLRALLDAVRTSKDGEFVTVQSNDGEVRVAKQAGQLLVHVREKGRDKDAEKKHQVEIKIPMKVVDALFSAGKDELDLLAAIHALSAQGDTELVSVRDDENTVRIWLDSRNSAD